jgi:hypothetical protein
MGKVPLRWSIIGAVIGALGFAHNLFLLSAIINKADVRHWWLTLGLVLCPACSIPLRNVGLIFVLNCAVYALLFLGLRIAWVRLSGRH